MSLAHPGFADPVRDSQATFRAVLDAMARPGRIHEVVFPHNPPPGLDRATAAVLLTLVDAESPLFLDDAAGAYREWITFHCGAPLAAAPEASFALALGPVALETFGTGSDEAPQDGATVVLQVGTLGSGPSYRLSGPGLAGPAQLAVSGLPKDFVDGWTANRALFPRGIDLILCAGNRLAALPRTVRVEIV